MSDPEFLDEPELTLVEVETPKEEPPVIFDFIEVWPSKRPPDLIN